MDIGPRLKLSPEHLCFLFGRTIKETKRLIPSHRYLVPYPSGGQGLLSFDWYSAGRK